MVWVMLVGAGIVVSIVVINGPLHDDRYFRAEVVRDAILGGPVGGDDVAYVSLGDVGNRCGQKRTAIGFVSSPFLLGRIAGPARGQVGYHDVKAFGESGDRTSGRMNVDAGLDGLPVLEGALPGEGE